MPSTKHWICTSTTMTCSCKTFSSRLTQGILMKVQSQKEYRSLGIERDTVLKGSGLTTSPIPASATKPSSMSWAPTLTSYLSLLTTMRMSLRRSYVRFVRKCLMSMISSIIWTNAARWANFIRKDRKYKRGLGRLTTSRDSVSHNERSRVKIKG